MYIVLALIASAALGIATHLALPYRPMRGVILTPGTSVAVAAAAYSLLTWLQWGEGNVWLWVVSLGAGVVAAVAVTLIACIARTRADAAARERFRIA